MIRARHHLTAATVAAASLAAVAFAADLSHWRSSRRGLPVPPPDAPASEAIVVLGYGNRGTRANAVNRYRVRAGLRSIDPRVPRTTVVLSGGPVHSEEPEARIMARYARRRGYRGRLVLETESMSTRENLLRVIPLVEDADSLVLVSNSPHAEMARAALGEMRPDLAARLRRAAEHRFGEVLPFKVLGTVIAMRHRRRPPRA